MLPDIARKRPAEVVRRETVTAIIPRVRAVEVVRRPSKRALLREVYRMERRGEIAWASEVLCVSYRNGGGFAVKVGRIADPPKPMPMWAKLVTRIGLVLIGFTFALAAFAAAMGALIGSLLALPWMTILGCLGMIALLAMCTRGGRACCRVVVEVWH
jgi:hypothetical protein